MAEKIIEIRVNYESALSQIGLVEEKVRILKQQQKELNLTTTEGVNKNAEITSTLKLHRQELSTLTREVVNQYKEQKTQIGYIEKLEAEVSNLTLSYKRLSQAELEGGKGAEVTQKLKDKRDELSRLNEAYGNYTHSVGNYAKGTAQLAINMGQILKEAPAFAVSARIGIMALSNNLVPLAESIKAVQEQNKILQAQGKETQSVLKTVGASIFGLTGMLSIGVALLTAFGPALLTWAGNLFKAKESIDDVTESNKKMITTLEGSGEFKQGLKNVAEMDRLFSAAANGGVKEKKQALDKFNETFNDTNTLFKSVNEAEDYYIKNKDKYIQANYEMAMADALMNQAVEKGLELRAIQNESSEPSFIKKSFLLVGGETDIAQLRIDAEAEKKVRIAAIQKQIDELLGLSNSYYSKSKALFNKEKDDLKGQEKEKRDEKVRTFEFEMRIQEANARAIKDDMAREIETVIAANDKKKKEAADHIIYLQGLADKGNKEAISQLKDTKEKEKELETALENQKISQVEDIRAKYFDRYQKELLSFTEKSKNEITKLFENDKKEREKNAKELEKSLYDNEKNALDDKLVIAKGNIDAEAELKKQQLNLQMNDELQAANLTESQKTAIVQKNAKLRHDIEVEAWMAKADMGLQMVNMIGELAGKETEIGKAAAATAIGIETAKDAYKTGAQAFTYFAAGNIPMGIFATAQTALIIGLGAKRISDVYNVKDDTKSLSSGSNTTQTTVTEKFHTGGTIGGGGEVPITALGGESVNTIATTQMFAPILSQLNQMGGGKAITSGVGNNSTSGEDMMARAFSKALLNMPPPVMAWSEFQNQYNRQKQLENNKIIR